MSTLSKNSYPKAMPAHSVEVLASYNTRLSQSNDELAAQAKRLASQNKALAENADRLRRRTLVLGVTCAIAILIAGAALAFAFRQTRPVAVLETDVALDLPTLAPKIAPLALPTNAISKPDSAGGSISRVTALESLGGLSATHLFQTYLNIGLLADGVESETYTIEEADKNLQSVADMMKLVDTQLAKLAKTGLDADDLESMRQIQAVSTMLHLQVRFLRGYWTTGEAQHATDYHEAREASWSGLSRVLGSD